jgi:lactate permease
MLLAYQQLLDPLAVWNIPWSPLWSTLLAAVPVLVLFWCLVPMRMLAPKAGFAGAVAAVLVAILVYQMPAAQTLAAFADGAWFGLMPVGWTIFNAMLLYNITVETGQFTIIRRSVAGLSGDARIQAVLIGFSFGAFLEGAAGGGTPVAICGAIMVGLGFDPFLAAVLCLIANTSPVAYGGLGTPLIVLSGVTDGLTTDTLSIMAGHQLPLLSCVVPLWMVRCMCSWRKTFAIWPALVVAGGSFALFQFTFATIHAYLPEVVLWPMTDIGGGIFSLVVTAIFLKFWRPHDEWHYKPLTPTAPLPPVPKEAVCDPHAAEAAALLTSADEPIVPTADRPLTARSIALAWMPFGLMSVLLLLTGLVRQEESHRTVYIGPVRTKFSIPVPTLDGTSMRDQRLHPVALDKLGVAMLASNSPLSAVAHVAIAHRVEPKPEKAVFDIPWLTAPGTAVFFAAVLSMVLLRMNTAQIGRVLHRTCLQMKIPIPTIAFMLGLSYVTRYAGMDATLGYAFAHTGALYPFFAAILGWLGVFLTGTDAGSNALFGSLQQITARTIYDPATFAHLSGRQLEALICTANSTGGVMGKMIDAQSICVATAATHQIGREADLFKAVVWHSIILAAIVGLLTLLQAYVPPFTHMVPMVH